MLFTSNRHNKMFEQLPIYIQDVNCNYFFDINWERGVLRWNLDSDLMSTPYALPVVDKERWNGSSISTYLSKHEFVPITIVNGLLIQSQIDDLFYTGPKAVGSRAVTLPEPPIQDLTANVESVRDLIPEDMLPVWDALPENLWDAFPDSNKFFVQRPEPMQLFLEAVNSEVAKLRAEGYYEVDASTPNFLPSKVAAGRRRGVGQLRFDNEQLEQIPYDPSAVFSAFSTYGGQYDMPWWREVLQNSLDAILLRRQKLSSYRYSGRIDIDYEEGDEYNTVTIRDNGIGMTKEVLYKALLSFGGSGKGRQGFGTTGGFGKAKELIYVPWLGYEIETTIYDESRQAAIRTTAFGKHFERQKMQNALETIVPGSEGNPYHDSIGTTLRVYMGRETISKTDPDTGDTTVEEYDYRVSLNGLDPIIKRSYIEYCTLYVNGGKKSLTEGPEIRHQLTGGFEAGMQEPFQEFRCVRNRNQGLVSFYVDTKPKRGRKFDDIIVRQNGLYMFSHSSQPPSVKGMVRIECSGSALALFSDGRTEFSYAPVLDENGNWMEDQRGSLVGCHAYVQDLIAKLQVDGTYGLDKKKDVTLVNGGTDITALKDEKLRELATKRKRSIQEGSYGRELEEVFAELMEGIEIQISAKSNQLAETEGIAEERSEKLKGVVDQLVKAIEDRDAEDDIQDGGGEWGSVDGESLNLMIEKLPIRASAESIVDNSFWSPRLVVRSNNGEQAIDKRFMFNPNEIPHEYAFRLLDFYTNCVRACALVMNANLTGYATGFIFNWSEDGKHAIGLHMGAKSDGGPAILIAPTKMEPYRDEYGDVIYYRGVEKGFKHKHRWSLSNPKDRHQLLAIACHEVIHAMGYHQHNDEFASILTDAAGSVIPAIVPMLGHFYKASGERYKRLKRETPQGLIEQNMSDYLSPLLQQYKPKRGRRKKAELGIRPERSFSDPTPLVATLIKLQETDSAVIRIEPDTSKIDLSQHGTQEILQQVPFPIFVEIDPLAYYRYVVYAAETQSMRGTYIDITLSGFVESIISPERVLITGYKDMSDMVFSYLKDMGHSVY